MRRGLISLLWIQAKAINNYPGRKPEHSSGAADEAFFLFNRQELLNRILINEELLPMLLESFFNRDTPAI